MPADVIPVEAPSPITVITATWLETWITLLVLRRAARVTQAGVGAEGKLDGLSDRIIVCGLAGALSPALHPGTVVIPHCIGQPDGERIECDPELVAELATAARTMGHEPVHGSLLTTSTLVTGGDRVRWAQQGFDAVDMESAHLFGQGVRGAVVRVILDTPERELSATWEHPSAALRRPLVWIEALRLAIDAPRATVRAARIVRHALRNPRQHH